MHNSHSHRFSSPTQPINFLSFNSNSLFNKFDELLSLLKNFPSRPVFICIFETWCRPSEPDSLCNLPQYKLFRRDRRKRSGGGAAVYVHESITDSCEKLRYLESSNEDIWLRIRLKNDPRTYALGCIYRPPDSECTSFCSSLEHILRQFQPFPSNLILTGDFNAHCSEWLETDKTDSCGEQLSDLFHTYSLEQVVDFPTNLHCGQLKACLDLIVTNLQDITATSLPPIGKSDHDLLQCYLSTTMMYSGSHLHHTCMAWCWNRGNF